VDVRSLRLSTPRCNEIRTAEVIGVAVPDDGSATGLPIEHLPQSTLLALRRIDRLGLEAQFATRTYYDCLLPMPVARPTPTLQPRCFPTVRCSSTSTRSCTALRRRR
jgi:hypothetical protein